MTEYIVKAADYAIDYNNGDSAFKDCERIVRCRDCMFFDARGNIGQWCTLLEFGMKNIADGFCAWGERRD